jgi:hypothetical protein
MSGHAKIWSRIFGSKYELLNAFSVSWKINDLDPLGIQRKSMPWTE